MSTPEYQPSATLMAGNGMVCSIDHLASEAGLSMLRAGGSAADAAVAASAVLAVTSPHVCGAGGDLLAVVVPPGGVPVALNASGRAGSGADPERLRSEGHTAMPFRGDVRAATVPGCVDGWLALHDRFGRLDIAQVLAPARSYAEEGFPASPLLASSAATVAHLPDAADLGPGPLRPGARVKRPGMGRVLSDVVTDGRDGFYRGEFGEALVELGDGEYTPADLAATCADWVDAVALDAWGQTLWTVPPNSQGYLTLTSSWIASGLDLPDDPADPLWAHLLVEASVQAALDRVDVLYDGADPAPLLDTGMLDARRRAVRRDRAAHPAGEYGQGDTIALCAVDADRMGVSLLQSNASGFGSHLIVPGVRVFLNNRGVGFSLVAGHPAEYRPGRRPPHTLAPLAATAADGSLAAVAGTMGGDAQPQILLQLLARTRGDGQAPGDAVAAGRWSLSGGANGFDTWSDQGRGLTVRVEGHAPEAWATGLSSRGHRVEVTEAYSHGFGHAHLISVDGDHLSGGTDPRPRSGSVAGY